MDRADIHSEEPGSDVENCQALKWQFISPLHSIPGFDLKRKHVILAKNGDLWIRNRGSVGGSGGWWPTLIFMLPV